MKTLILILAIALLGLFTITTGAFDFKFLHHCMSLKALAVIYLSCISFASIVLILIFNKQ